MTRCGAQFVINIGNIRSINIQECPPDENIERRVRHVSERYGTEAVLAQPRGQTRRRRIQAGTIEIADPAEASGSTRTSRCGTFTSRSAKHQVVSHNWLRLMLQEAAACRSRCASIRSPTTRRPIASPEQVSIGTSIVASRSRPARKESKFIKLANLELELVLSACHERVVRNDNAVGPQSDSAIAAEQAPGPFVRCPVTVHRFSDGYRRTRPHFS